MSRTGSSKNLQMGGSVSVPQDMPVQGIEDASIGLAYSMRKYNSVFWHENRNHFVIHVPKNFRDHRSYEYWILTKEQVEGADRCLRDNQPPFRWMSKAKPPGRVVRRKLLKGYGGKTSI